MNYKRETIKRLESMAQEMRLDALIMALSAGNGGAHLGGSLSCIEILAVLYGEILHIDPSRPDMPERDRFLASKNHCVLAHLPALSAAGFFPRSELTELTKNGGRLNGYPYNLSIGLEYSGGSLGMAISVGVGIALALREEQQNAQVYVMMGDGELNEGSIWEAFMSAAHYKLDNLCAIIDRNHLSYDGDTEEIMAIEDIAAKMKAFNWHVTQCNGHDIGALLDAFGQTVQGRPRIVIADTIKGKGVSFIENKAEWHQHVLTQKQYEQAREEVLGGPYEK